MGQQLEVPPQYIAGLLMNIGRDTAGAFVRTVFTLAAYNIVRYVLMRQDRQKMGAKAASGAPVRC